MITWRRCATVALTTLLVACGSAPRQPAPATPTTPTPSGAPTQGLNQPPAQLATTPSPYHCAYTAGAKGTGNFYLDDGPQETLPEWLDFVPEPTPKAEPLHRFANNPYTVLGQNFTPLRTAGKLNQQGMASWYGRKFNGQKTSTGEVYDMFTMTAASPILPLPSYARVTNVKNGRSVIVRVNDRGPFKRGRVMDLSFLAACRLGYAMNGSAEVVVESLAPGEIPPPVNVAQAAANPMPADAPVATLPASSAGVTAAAPAAAPVAEAKPERVPVSVASGGGVYLQLGAFGSLTNAENFRDHMARDLNGEGATVTVQSAGNLHRVKLGPFADRKAALAAAERITGSHNLQVVVTQ
ncbi:septal ring lytic transglycosylase RlpA family protein [Amantichitinum ursilacus]|nr:septal ring lytic transglycosylase RlpA family protein [Amantichitinum ursilacus]